MEYSERLDPTQHTKGIPTYQASRQYLHFSDDANHDFVPYVAGYEGADVHHPHPAIALHRNSKTA